MERGSRNSYNRKYGSRGLNGDQMDRKVEKEHLDTDEILNELGIPVNTVTSLLGGQVDVQRKTVVDPSTDVSETSYNVQTPLGEFNYQIED